MTIGADEELEQIVKGEITADKGTIEAALNRELSTIRDKSSYLGKDCYPIGEIIIKNAEKLHKMLGDDFIPYLEKAVRIDLDPKQVYGINTIIESGLKETTCDGHTVDRLITGGATLSALPAIINILGKDKLHDVFLPLAQNIQNIEAYDLNCYHSTMLNGKDIGYIYNEGYCRDDFAFLKEISDLEKILSKEELKPLVEKMLELVKNSQKRDPQAKTNGEIILDADLKGLVSVLGEDATLPILKTAILDSKPENIMWKCGKITEAFGEKGIERIKAHPKADEIVPAALRNLKIDAEKSDPKLGKFCFTKIAATERVSQIIANRLQEPLFAALNVFYPDVIATLKCTSQSNDANKEKALTFGPQSDILSEITVAPNSKFGKILAQKLVEQQRTAGHKK